MSYQIQAPADVPGYALPAYFSCLRWALGENGIRAAFERETGKHYSPAKCALDLMIDDATGYREAYVKAFVEWFNANVWGTFS